LLVMSGKLSIPALGSVNVRERVPQLTLTERVVVIVAWFAILFIGRYPRGIFDFVEGVIRWHNRVIAYAFVLITDQYPPFSLAV
jgi:hypothetical protein